MVECALAGLSCHLWNVVSGPAGIGDWLMKIIFHIKARPHSDSAFLNFITEWDSSRIWDWLYRLIETFMGLEPENEEATDV